MGRIANAIASFAVRLGAQPPRAHQRRFEAAVVNRLTESWVATQASIDQELRGDLDRLRRRSRDLAKNNEYMAKFLRMVRNNVIGQCMTLQSRPADGSRIDTLAAQAVERHFATWAKPEHCDVTGRTGLWTMLRSACDDLARDGELLIRLRPGRGQYGLQLQRLDVERLDTQMNRARTERANAIVMGVEVDDFQRPVAYYLRQKLATHGGALDREGERERVPAADILHRYVALEPEQTRGVPWAHAAMRRLNDLGGYREAAVIAARIGASKMGFFTTPETDSPPGTDGKDAAGVPYTTATPGEFGVLQPGQDFRTFDPAYPHEQFGDFVKAALRGIASGLGVSYNSLANDLEGVNFSSIRSGVLEERDEWMVLQDWFIEQVLDPIFDRWLRLAMTMGQVTQIGSAGPVPLPLAKREKFAEHVWMPRRWGWVDPVKDVQATVLAIEANLTTATDAAARNGVDIEDVMATKQREKELATQYGVDLTPARKVKPGKPGAAAGGQAPVDDQDEGRAAGEAFSRDLTAMIDARLDRIESMGTARQAPDVIVNVPQPVVHVAAPEVHVHVPDQPAPVVNVAAAEVRASDVIVNVPAPVVNVAAPEVDVTVEATMPAPEITLEMPARRSVTEIERDSAGRITRTNTLEKEI